MLRLFTITFLLMLAIAPVEASPVEDLLTYNAKVAEYTDQYDLIQKEIQVLNLLILYEWRDSKEGQPPPAHILDSLNYLADKVSAVRRDGHQLQRWLWEEFDLDRPHQNHQDIAASSIYDRITINDDKLEAQMSAFNGVILNWRFRYVPTDKGNSGAEATPENNKRRGPDGPRFSFAKLFL